MKELEKQFTGIGEVKGFTFTQIKQNEVGFIYEVESLGSKHYEVFKRRENSRFGCVSYPKSKSFGIWAWTTSDLDRAYSILESFNNPE